MDSAVKYNTGKKPLLPRMKKYAGFYLLCLRVRVFLVVFRYLAMLGVDVYVTKYHIF